MTRPVALAPSATLLAALTRLVLTLLASLTAALMLLARPVLGALAALTALALAALLRALLLLVALRVLLFVRHGRFSDVVLGTSPDATLSTHKENCSS
jgi:hypothetical protein